MGDREPIANSGSPAAIAWSGDPGDAQLGRWGAPAELSVPVDARGLLLADGVFETLLLEQGRARLLAEHLGRWQRGAQLLGLPAPPAAEPLQVLIREAALRSGISEGSLRLNWCRSGGGRGMDPAPPWAAAARFWLQLTAGQPCFDPLRVIISRWEQRNPASRLSRCKSFAYTAQLLARREAIEAGADDALMLALSGELSCGAAANLLVLRDGIWLTPPLASGCLPGVMRGRALALGLAKEETLQPEDLLGGEGAVLINSLGCRPLRRCGVQELRALEAAAAERLWRGLLKGSAPQA
ncbi:MAG: aminotransferase class IV [Cyanobium sp.]